MDDDFLADQLLFDDPVPASLPLLPPAPIGGAPRHPERRWPRGRPLHSTLPTCTHESHAGSQRTGHGGANDYPTKPDKGVKEAVEVLLHGLLRNVTK